MPRLGGAPPPARARRPDADNLSHLVAPVGGTCCCLATFLFFFGTLCLAGLDPNHYGIFRNLITGYVTENVVRGGVSLCWPWQTFINFPATQLTLEFSPQSIDRYPAVETRTGADPEDPDSGGQPIAISCALQIQFVPENLKQIYIAFGGYTGARQRYLLLASNEISNAAQSFTPRDFWHIRHEVAAKMQKRINATLWSDGFVVARKFEILQVKFPAKYENMITAVQVAEQSKVVNVYTQRVKAVQQSIEVLRYENLAVIANITAAAQATSKEIIGRASRDAFNLKQGMKAKLYAQLKHHLGFETSHMSEYFKMKAIKSQETEVNHKLVVGLSPIKHADKR